MRIRAPGPRRRRPHGPKRSACASRPGAWVETPARRLSSGVMAARSPARFLAPIALVAFAFALYTIVNDARDRGGSSSGGVPANTTPAAKGSKKQSSSKKSAKRKRKTYVIKSGDTPSGIAEKTGVSVATLQKLNPDLDPQALTVGQRLRLVK